jgi:hypothetical protein
LLHSTVSKSDVLGGVSEFNQWFSSVSGAQCSSSISHDAFGNLRGLTAKGKAEGELMKVPRSVVLQADFSLPDWDAQLARLLWKECSTIASSSLSGYCSLLTRAWEPTASTDVPPSTAQDSLRHWTDQQKSLLTTKPAGQRILEFQEKQEAQWRKKFDENVNGMTWEQFEWAMEVVHSRAFCGEFGTGASALPPAIGAAIPLIAAAAGWIYYFQVHGDEDIVLLSLAVIAALPTLLNLVNRSPPVAVLLPLIDSANHREEADSKIDYNPLSDSFTLSAGSKCVVEEGGKKQLYISYGTKRDTELLLNYGFLEGVSLKGEDTNSYRQALAEAFLARN